MKNIFSKVFFSKAIYLGGKPSQPPQPFFASRRPKLTAAKPASIINTFAMKFIDADEDHVRRPTNIGHVMEMLDRQRCTEYYSCKDYFIITISETRKYSNCVCGHSIQTNYIATHAETGLSAVYGSECITKADKSSEFIMIRKCTMCFDTIGLKNKTSLCRKCNMK